MLTTGDGEVLHIIHTHVRQIPERYGKLTNEELRAQRVQSLNDGKWHEKDFG